MPRSHRPLRGGAFTRDGLFELLAGLALAVAGYLLLPRPQAELARWAFFPLAGAALLLPALKALLRRLGPSASEPRAAGWGWLLGALLALALGGAALVAVWLELDSPLFGETVRLALQALGHLPAALGLTVGLALILVGFANDQWRVALVGMVWAVVGLVLDILLWGRVLPLWFLALWTVRRATAVYLLALGGFTALVGLAALIRYLLVRPRAGDVEGQNYREEIA
jgi:hypothetical protein